MGLTPLRVRGIDRVRPARRPDDPHQARLRWRRLGPLRPGLLGSAEATGAILPRSPLDPGSSAAGVTLSVAANVDPGNPKAALKL